MGTVSLQKVSKTYTGGVAAVTDLTLEIADGEFVALVGPSGCGKSSTLRVVAGLEDPTSGTVSIGGRVVNGVHPRDRGIAMVFQNYALYPHMTVSRNMAFALRLRRVAPAEIERRVRDAARMLGIEDVLSRKPRELSGGQRQRAAVGRAIVREPPPGVFLFDEPLSNLDAALRVAMRAELKALHQRLGTTTIHVTHDQEEAMTLGDRIAVMHRGRLQQVGPPLEVYARPANRFVASFIGTPGMNFIDGTLERDPPDGAAAFRERGGEGARVPLPGPHADRLAPWIGREVVLGVRPQALSEGGGAASAGGASLVVTVEVVEPLGEQMDAVVRTPAGTRLVARLTARSGLSPGARIAMSVDAGRGGVHCYEPGEFGRNLLA